MCSQGNHCSIKVKPKHSLSLIPGLFLEILKSGRSYGLSYVTIKQKLSPKLVQTYLLAITLAKLLFQESALSWMHTKDFQTSAFVLRDTQLQCIWELVHNHYKEFNIKIRCIFAYFWWYYTFILLLRLKFLVKKWNKVSQKSTQGENISHGTGGNTGKRFGQVHCFNHNFSLVMCFHLKTPTEVAKSVYLLTQMCLSISWTQWLWVYKDIVRKYNWKLSEFIIYNNCKLLLFSLYCNCSSCETVLRS